MTATSQQLPHLSLATARTLGDCSAGIPASLMNGNPPVHIGGSNWQAGVPEHGSTTKKGVPTDFSALEQVDGAEQLHTPIPDIPDTIETKIVRSSN